MGQNNGRRNDFAKPGYGLIHARQERIEKLIDIFQIEDYCLGQNTHRDQKRNDFVFEGWSGFGEMISFGSYFPAVWNWVEGFWKGKTK
jgi:hypothetical protein